MAQASRAPGRAIASVLSGLLVGVALAGCGANSHGSGAARKSRPATVDSALAHPLTVVATAFPLAQLVAYVGGADVKVSDLAPPGVQPEGLTPSAAQRRELASAQLIVEVGAGYQPKVEAAAASRRHLALLPAVTKKAGSYEFWLDPYLWSSAAGKLSDALSALSPAGKRQFENGARDFESLASSIASDYYSSLSSCPLREFVTADDAFGRMASAFSLVDVAVSSTGVKSALATIAQYSIPGVFSEEGVPSAQLLRVARADHLEAKSLDPMELAPVSGTKYQTYFDVMEANLHALEGPLECDTSESYY